MTTKPTVNKPSQFNKAAKNCVEWKLWPAIRSSYRGEFACTMAGKVLTSDTADEDEQERQGGDGGKMLRPGQFTNR